MSQISVYKIIFYFNLKYILKCINQHNIFKVHHYSTNLRYDIFIYAPKQHQEMAPGAVASVEPVMRISRHDI